MTAHKETFGVRHRAGGLLGRKSPTQPKPEGRRAGRSEVDMKRRLFCYAVILTVFTTASEARAETATDYVRQRIERLYELLGPSAPDGGSPTKRQAARGVLDEMFDWNEMAKRSLDRYWEERTAAERTEFVRLFSELFQRTYVSRIQLADREKFQYL